MPVHVVLVGLMGAGKSTVGQALAAMLGRSLVDNDEQVLAMTGLTVAEISARRDATARGRGARPGPGVAGAGRHHRRGRGHPG